MQAASIVNTGVTGTDVSNNVGSVSAAAPGRKAADAPGALPSFAQMVAEKVANPPASQPQNNANTSQNRTTSSSAHPQTQDATPRVSNGAGATTTAKAKKDDDAPAKDAKGATVPNVPADQAQVHAAPNTIPPSQVAQLVLATPVLPAIPDANLPGAGSSPPAEDANSTTGALPANGASSTPVVTLATATLAASPVVQSDAQSPDALQQSQSKTPASVQNIAATENFADPSPAPAATSANSPLPATPAAANTVPETQSPSKVAPKDAGFPQQQATTNDPLNMQKTLPSTAMIIPTKNEPSAIAPAEQLAAKQAAPISSAKGPSDSAHLHNQPQVQHKDVFPDLTTTPGKPNGQTSPLATPTSSESTKLHPGTPPLAIGAITLNKPQPLTDPKPGVAIQTNAKAAGDTPVSRTDEKQKKTQDNATDDSNAATNSSGNPLGGDLKQKFTDNLSNAMANNSDPKPDPAGNPPPSMTAGAIKETVTPSKAAPDPAANSPLPPLPDEKRLGTPDVSSNVSAAQLNSAAGQSEMHIALQTEKLGTVELHAQVTGEQVGAAITVDKKEAHAVLAAELPMLQQALSDKQLRVEHIWLVQGTLDHATSGHANGGSQQHHGGHSASAHREQPYPQTMPALLERAMQTTEMYDAQGRLSVLA